MFGIAMMSAANKIMKKIVLMSLKINQKEQIVQRKNQLKSMMKKTA